MNQSQSGTEVVWRIVWLSSALNHFESTQVKNDSTYDVRNMIQKCLCIPRITVQDKTLLKQNRFFKNATLKMKIFCEVRICRNLKKIKFIYLRDSNWTFQCQRMALLASKVIL